MIACDIIVTFYIFRLLKYDRIFGENLEHYTYGVKKILDPAFCGDSVPGLIPEIYASFFMTHLSSYNNIFETEAYFGGNRMVLFWHLYR